MFRMEPFLFIWKLTIEIEVLQSFQVEHLRPFFESLDKFLKNLKKQEQHLSLDAQLTNCL